MGLLRNLSPLILASGVAAFQDPFDFLFDIELNASSGRVTELHADTPFAGVSRTVSGIIPDAACNTIGNIRTEFNVSRFDIITSPSDFCEIQGFIGYDFSTPENFTADNHNALQFNYAPFYNLDLPPFGSAEQFSWVACTETCGTAYPGGLPTGTVASHTLPASCGRHAHDVSFGSLVADLGLWAMSPLSLEDFGAIGCLFGEVTSVVGTTFGLNIFQTGTITTPGSLLGDPHLVGFHGERTELMNSEPTYYSIFCNANSMVNIRTEPTSSGAVYMLAVNLNIANEIFNIELSSFDNLHQLKANAPSFMTVDGEVLKINSGDFSMEISKSNEAGVEFLDVTLSAAAGKAGGIIGRTLEKALSASEFSAVEKFVVNQDSHTGAHFCTM